MAQEVPDRDDVHPRIEEPGGAGVTAVVEAEVGDPGLRAGRLEADLDVHVGPLRLGVREDIGRVPVSILDGHEHREQRVVQEDRPGLAVLRVPKLDFPLLEIDVLPAKLQDLALPHAGLKGREDDGLQPGRAGFQEPQLLLGAKNPLPVGPLLGEELDLADGVLLGHAPVDGTVEHLLEDGQLPVRSRAGDAFLQPLGPELLDREGSDVLEGIASEGRQEPVPDHQLVPLPASLVNLGVGLEIERRKVPEELALNRSDPETLLMLVESGRLEGEDGLVSDRGQGLHSLNSLARVVPEIEIPPDRSVLLPSRIDSTVPEIKASFGFGLCHLARTSFFLMLPFFISTGGSSQRPRGRGEIRSGRTGCPLEPLVKIVLTEANANSRPPDERDGAGLDQPVDRAGAHPQVCCGLGNGQQSFTHKKESRLEEFFLPAGDKLEQVLVQLVI